MLVGKAASMPCNALFCLPVFPLPQIQHLFFKCHTEPISHCVLNTRRELVEVRCRCTGAAVDQEIGVFLRNLRSSDSRAF
jgi:hypothetical protein